MLLHNLLQSTVHPSVLELQKHLPRREKAQTMEWLRKRKRQYGILSAVHVWTMLR